MIGLRKKSLLILLCCIQSCLTALCDLPTSKDISEIVRHSDVIAFVTVTEVETETSFIPGDERTKIKIGTAVVERVLKGMPNENIILKQVVTQEIISKATYLDKGRYFVFLNELNPTFPKKMNTIYEIAHWRNIWNVYGAGSGRDVGRVTGKNLPCMSAAEMISIIEKWKK